MVLSTGSGALFPRPQRDIFFTISASSSRRSKSSISPFPATIFSRISNILFVPSRQGVHLPQDSRCVKLIKKRATSTIQVSTFITTRPPEPTIAPNFLTESKSSGSSKCFSVKHPPDGPPICTALNSEPFFNPPPIS